MRLFIPLVAVAAAIAVLFAVTASGAGSTTTVATRSGHLANRKGVTLYRFMKDSKSRSRCSGACAIEWPPLMAKGKVVAKGGVQKSHLGSIKRSGGRQVTYFGHPLYTFEGDGGRPGKTTGQGLSDFGGRWSVVATNGRPGTVTAGAPPSRPGY